MTVTTRGERELTLRFDTFPARAHQRLEQRIGDLVAQLDAKSQAAAPVDTGRLRSEITEKVYGDSPDRVAGYVSVFAPGNPKEYPKAATLEYGSDKVRKIYSNSRSMLDRFGRKRRIVERMTKAAHIQAYKYLRAPLETMRGEIEAALDGALADVAAEESA